MNEELPMGTSTSPWEELRPMAMSFCRTKYSNSRPWSLAIGLLAALSLFWPLILGPLADRRPWGARPGLHTRTNSRANLGWRPRNAKTVQLARDLGRTKFVNNSALCWWCLSLSMFCRFAHSTAHTHPMLLDNEGGVGARNRSFKARRLTRQIQIRHGV